MGLAHAEAAVEVDAGRLGHGPPAAAAAEEAAEEPAAGAGGGAAEGGGEPAQPLHGLGLRGVGGVRDVGVEGDLPEPVGRLEGLEQLVRGDLRGALG